MEAGYTNDASSITSPTYPWITYRPGYPIEDHGDTTRVSKNSIPNMPPLPPPFGSFLSAVQPVPDGNRHEHNTESYRTPAEQQISRTTVGKAVSQPPGSDSGYQSASIEGSFMQSNDGGLFDVSWLNTSPAFNLWDYPLNLAEMSSRDPMP